MSIINGSLNILLDLQPHCNCEFKSGQPASLPRQIKKLGYVFKQDGNKTAFLQYCKKCQRKTPHRQLLSKIPVPKDYNRNIFDKKFKKIFYNHHKCCAFSGSKNNLQIDHKFPHERSNGLEPSLPKNYAIEDLDKFYQPITVNMNSVKREKCNKCTITGIRQSSYDGIAFYYDGNEKWVGECKGCYWYDPIKWRQELSGEKDLKIELYRK